MHPLNALITVAKLLLGNIAILAPYLELQHLCNVCYKVLVHFVTGVEHMYMYVVIILRPYRSR